MSAVWDIAAYLTDRGFTDVFAHLPEDPDRCIALYEYSGRPPGRTKGSTAPVYELPRLQIIVRGEAMQEARSRIEAVYLSLEGLRDFTGADHVYERASALQSPFSDPAGRDQNNRSRYIVNFELKRKPK